MTTYLIIGAGKIAKHFQYYLSALGQTPLSWDRAQQSHNPHILKSKISEASHVLLAISDSGLETFYRTHLEGLDKTVVHFSGSVFFEGALSAHPLMSFGPELYSLEIYRRIHFMVSGCDSLKEALPGLPNSFSWLAPEKKPLYHALCVLGGNFPVILWQKMFAEFSRLGIPAEAAGLYLETVLANTLKNPLTALTGPLARRDQGTVTKNLQSLAGDPFQNVYRSFVETIAPELLTSSDRQDLKERPS
jgi:hypothetical protein